jgi:hypothetical protein
MKGQTKEELTKALAYNFLPTDKIVLEQNILVLNTGSKLVMFDSGMGTAKPFGPTTDGDSDDPAEMMTTGIAFAGGGPRCRLLPHAFHTRCAHLLDVVCLTDAEGNAVVRPRG